VKKIQFICDHFIGHYNDFNYNPNVFKHHTKKCIYINDINCNINNKYKIYCNTHILTNIELLINKLRFLLNPFILILHNSDYIFNNKELILFEKLPNLIYIYSTNINVIYNKLKFLPIGLANSQWNHGNLSIFNDVYNSLKSNISSINRSQIKKIIFILILI